MTIRGWATRMQSVTYPYSYRCCSRCTFSASSTQRANTWGRPDIMTATSYRVTAFDALRAPVKRVALWIAVFLVMAVICLPGLWVVLNAFRPNVAILSNQPISDASSYTLDNFRNMFGF